MRILTLIENTTATDKLYIEHGLSLYIEHNGKKVILDTGASEKWKKNAERMRIDPTKLDYGVISHNHIDHTGGIDALLGASADIKIFMRKNALGEFYKKMGFLKILISNPPSFYERRKANFVFFNSFQEVCSGMFLLTDEIGDPSFFAHDNALMQRKEGKYMRDDFSHELFMVTFPTLEQSDGCVVISSCSHRGIVNILETVKITWPHSPIIGVVGGFHLMGKKRRNFNCPQSHIEEIAKKLSTLVEGTIYTCHCTGVKGYEVLKTYLGDQIQYLQTGEELIFNREPRRPTPPALNKV